MYIPFVNHFLTSWNHEILQYLLYTSTGINQGYYIPSLGE